MHLKHQQAQEQYELAKLAVRLARKKELKAWKAMLRWEAVERIDAYRKQLYGGILKQAGSNRP